MDVNVYQENIFHTKMLLKEIELDNYIFGIDEVDLSTASRKKIHKALENEMLEIFYGRNLSR
jgi:S-adenosylmethionine decarboxylase